MSKIEKNAFVKHLKNIAKSKKFLFPATMLSLAATPRIVAAIAHKDIEAITPFGALPPSAADDVLDRGMWDKLQENLNEQIGGKDE